MDTLSALIAIGLAALTHATFQLSISVLTLLSGHALGTKLAHAKLLRRMFGFTLGAASMTALLVAAATFKWAALFNGQPPLLLQTFVFASLAGVGLTVWLFYFRKGKGTTLWLPRAMAAFLETRAKATSSSAEAFSLGLATIIGELLFIAAPVLAASLLLLTLPGQWQLVGVALYTLIATLPLFVTCVLVGGGHKLSHIQKWREANKYFLQFAAGAGLIILSGYLYISDILPQMIARGLYL